MIDHRVVRCMVYFHRPNLTHIPSQTPRHRTTIGLPYEDKLMHIIIIIIIISIIIMHIITTETPTFSVRGMVKTATGPK